MSKNIIHLKYGAESIAELEITGSDQPWIHCKFSPLKYYGKHRDFLEDAQGRYVSGEVDNWDAFFNDISNKGYSLVGEAYQISRFIIIFEQDGNFVRVRGQRVKFTK